MALTASKLDTAPGFSFAAFVADDMTREILAPAARDHGWSKDSVRTGGMDAAVRTLTPSVCPDILLVDISDSRDPRADMAGLADVCDPMTRVIVLGTQNDATLFRDLLSAGVQDFLVKPVSTDMLHAALSDLVADAAAEAQPVQEEERRPEDERTIFTIGLRGGLGTSTLAAHIAAHLGGRDKKTLLLDMDLHFGVAALMFDLEPGRGLTDALENPSRVDGLFLERAVVKPTTQLSILAAEAPIGSHNALKDGALGGLIGVLEDSFPVRIIDLPRHHLADSMDALKGASDIILVTDLTLCGARDCIRMIGHLEKSIPGVTVHVVAAKSGQMGGEVSQPDFENSIERGLLGTIPFDPKAYLAAAKAGKLLFDTSPNSKPAQAYTKIADTILPRNDSETDKNAGLLGRLLRRH